MSFFDEQDKASRKPRIALMGEFSAGKSTLANLLIGQYASQVKVTATQCPPVWYRNGDQASSRLMMDGTELPLSDADWECVAPHDTRLITKWYQSEFLARADLIDMPGTSDPNMPTDIWEKVLPCVDSVIWCTPSTQAWRQSEAALWEQVPAALWDNSLLLVTRMDKVRSEKDRKRILIRVKRETEDLFCDVLPISLLSALENRNDETVLQQSGAAALIDRVAVVLDNIRSDTQPLPVPRKPEKVSSHEPAVEELARARVIVPRRVIRAPVKSDRTRFEPRPN